MPNAAQRRVMAKADQPLHGRTPAETTDRIDKIRLAMCELGDEIAVKRRERNLSLEQLGSELGIQRVVLHHIEHGRWIPEPAHVATLCEWLQRARTRAVSADPGRPTEEEPA